MMDQLKFLVTLIICLSFVSMNSNGFTFRFTSVDCSTSDKNTTSEHFCNVKTYSRNYTALNFGFNLNRELNKLNIRHLLFYKYGTVYRQALKAETELCSLMSKSSSNPLFDMVANIVRETAPEINHECPIKGFVKITNLTLNISTFLSIYPQGEYRTNWLFFDDQDEKIFLLRVYNTVKSYIKYLLLTKIILKKQNKTFNLN